jgi:hypothetical protein
MLGSRGRRRVRRPNQEAYVGKLTLVSGHLGRWAITSVVQSIMANWRTVSPLIFAFAAFVKLVGILPKNSLKSRGFHERKKPLLFLGTLLLGQIPY